MTPIKTTIIGSNFYVLEFDSLKEIMDNLDESVRYNDCGVISRHQDDAIEWFGRQFSGWSSVRNAIPQLWTEGVQTIESMLKELQDIELPTPHDRRRTRYWSEDDGEMDLERIMSNDPFCYESRKRAVREGPSQIRIAVNVASHASVSSSDVLWRGAAAICLAERLEAAGWSSEIIGCRICDNAYSDKSGTLIILPIKPYGDDISVPQCANLVSAWFYRSVMFQSQHNIHLPRASNYGGNPMNLSAAHDYLKTPNERLQIIDGIWNISDAVDFVRDTINQLNSNLERTHHA